MVPEITADISTLAAPGSLLKQKRIELGWPIEKVARSLLLSSTQIEALERDDYGSLSGATYVLGYWRSYSSLLGLDIEESIDLHKPQLRNPLSAITLEANHQKAQGHQEKTRKRSAFLFLMLSGIFLSVIWVWQNPEDNPFTQWVDNLSTTQLAKLNSDDSGELQSLSISTSQNQNTDETAEVKQRVSLPEPNFSDDYVRLEEDTETLQTDAGPLPRSSSGPLIGSVIEQALVENDGESIENQAIIESAIEDLSTAENEELLNDITPLINTVSPQTENAQPSAVNVNVNTGLVAIGGPETVDTETSLGATDPVEPVGEGVITQDASVSSDVTLASTAVSESDDLSASDQEPPLTEQVDETVIDPSSPRHLELLVETKTWIDVRDVKGEKLVYRTVESGQRLNLVGEPPFYVFIGTSSGVSVNYMGEPVAFKTHSSGLFARFKIGELQQ